jgi:hypothetical protein
LLTLTNPPPAAAKRRLASQKNFLCNSDLRAPPKIFKKEKKVFLLGSALTRGRRDSIRTRQSKNYFCGRKRILLCFGSFCFGAGLPPRRRVREECAADFGAG